MDALVILLIVLLLFGGIGASPTIGYWNHSYGWGPSGLIGLIVVIMLALLLLGRI